LPFCYFIHHGPFADEAKKIAKREEERAVSVALRKTTTTTNIPTLTSTATEAHETEI
jgi:hypothetical protein